MSYFVNPATFNNTASTITNTIYYDNGTWATQPVIYQQAPLLPTPSKGAVVPEDPVAWLKRRVDEVLWQPN